MRWIMAILLALVALLCVTKANAAVPVWEGGRLTAVTIEDGDSCWVAFETMREHGVDVTWEQFRRSKGCKALVHAGDTIRVPNGAAQSFTATPVSINFKVARTATGDDTVVVEIPPHATMCAEPHCEDLDRGVAGASSTSKPVVEFVAPHVVCDTAQCEMVGADVPPFTAALGEITTVISALISRHSAIVAAESRLVEPGRSQARAVAPKRNETKVARRGKTRSVETGSAVARAVAPNAVPELERRYREIVARYTALSSAAMEIAKANREWQKWAENRENSGHRNQTESLYPNPPGS